MNDRKIDTWMDDVLNWIRLSEKINTFLIVILPKEVECMIELIKNIY